MPPYVIHDYDIIFLVPLRNGIFYRRRFADKTSPTSRRFGKRRVPLGNGMSGRRRFGDRTSHTSRHFENRSFVDETSARTRTYPLRRRARKKKGRESERMRRWRCCFLN